MKKKSRFLKLVLVWCLLMGAFLTAGVLAVAWHTGGITDGQVESLRRLWSIELILSAVLKLWESKPKNNSKNKSKSEGSI